MVHHPGRGVIVAVSVLVFMVVINTVHGRSRTFHSGHRNDRKLTEEDIKRHIIEDFVMQKNKYPAKKFGFNINQPKRLLIRPTSSEEHFSLTEQLYDDSESSEYEHILEVQPKKRTQKYKLRVKPRKIGRNNQYVKKNKEVGDSLKSETTLLKYLSPRTRHRYNKASGASTNYLSKGSIRGKERQNIKYSKQPISKKKRMDISQIINDHKNSNNGLFKLPPQELINTRQLNYKRKHTAINFPQKEHGKQMKYQQSSETSKKESGLPKVVSGGKYYEITEDSENSSSEDYKNISEENIIVAKFPSTERSGQNILNQFTQTSNVSVDTTIDDNESEIKLMLQGENNAILKKNIQSYETKLKKAFENVYNSNEHQMKYTITDLPTDLYYTSEETNEFTVTDKSKLTTESFALETTSNPITFISMESPKTEMILQIMQDNKNGDNVEYLLREGQLDKNRLLLEENKDYSFKVDNDSNINENSPYKMISEHKEETEKYKKLNSAPKEIGGEANPMEKQLNGTEFMGGNSVIHFVQRPNFVSVQSGSKAVAKNDDEKGNKTKVIHTEESTSFGSNIDNYSIFINQHHKPPYQKNSSEEAFEINNEKEYKTSKVDTHLKERKVSNEEPDKIEIRKPLKKGFYPIKSVHNFTSTENYVKTKLRTNIAYNPPKGSEIDHLLNEKPNPNENYTLISAEDTPTFPKYFPVEVQDKYETKGGEGNFEYPEEINEASPSTFKVIRKEKNVETKSKESSSTKQKKIRERHPYSSDENFYIFKKGEQNYNFSDSKEIKSVNNPLYKNSVSSPYSYFKDESKSNEEKPEVQSNPVRKIDFGFEMEDNKYISKYFRGNKNITYEVVETKSPPSDYSLNENYHTNTDDRDVIHKYSSEETHKSFPKVSEKYESYISRDNTYPFKELAKLPYRPQTPDTNNEEIEYQSNNHLLTTSSWIYNNSNNSSKFLNVGLLIRKSDNDTQLTELDQSLTTTERNRGSKTFSGLGMISTEATKLMRHTKGPNDEILFSSLKTLTSENEYHEHNMKEIELPDPNSREFHSIAGLSASLSGSVLSSFTNDKEYPFNADTKQSSTNDDKHTLPLSGLNNLIPESIPETFTKEEHISEKEMEGYNQDKNKNTFQFSKLVNLIPESLPETLKPKEQLFPDKQDNYNHDENSSLFPKMENVFPGSLPKMLPRKEQIFKEEKGKNIQNEDNHYLHLFSQENLIPGPLSKTFTREEKISKEENGDSIQNEGKEIFPLVKQENFIPGSIPKTLLDGEQNISKKENGEYIQNEGIQSFHLSKLEDRMPGSLSNSLTREELIPKEKNEDLTQKEDKQTLPVYKQEHPTPGSLPKDLPGKEQISKEENRGHIQNEEKHSLRLPEKENLTSGSLLKYVPREEQKYKKKNGAYIQIEDLPYSHFSKKKNLILGSLPKTLLREEQIPKEENETYIKSEDKHTFPLTKQENLIPGSLSETLPKEQQISKGKNGKYFQNENKNSFHLFGQENFIPKSLLKNLSREEEISEGENERFVQNEDEDYFPLFKQKNLTTGLLSKTLPKEEQIFEEENIQNEDIHSYPFYTRENFTPGLLPKTLSKEVQIYMKENEEYIPNEDKHSFHTFNQENTIPGPYPKTEQREGQIGKEETGEYILNKGKDSFHLTKQEVLIPGSIPKSVPNEEQIAKKENWEYVQIEDKQNLSMSKQSNIIPEPLPINILSKEPVIKIENDNIHDEDKHSFHLSKQENIILATLPKTLSREEQIPKLEYDNYIQNDAEQTLPLSKQENLIPISFPKTISREEQISNQENEINNQNVDEHYFPPSKKEIIIPKSLTKILIREDQIPKEENVSYIQKEDNSTFPLSNHENLNPGPLLKTLVGKEEISTKENEAQISKEENGDYIRNKDKHYFPQSKQKHLIYGSLSKTLAREEQIPKEINEHYIPNEDKNSFPQSKKEILIPESITKTLLKEDQIPKEEIVSSIQNEDKLIFPLYNQENLNSLTLPKILAREEQISKEEYGHFIQNEDKHSFPQSKQENIIYGSLLPTSLQEEQISKEENGDYIQNEDKHSFHLPEQENLIPVSLPKALAREEQISKEENRDYTQSEEKHSFPQPKQEIINLGSLPKTLLGKGQMSMEENGEHIENENKDDLHLSKLEILNPGSLPETLLGEEQTFIEKNGEYILNEYKHTSPLSTQENLIAESLPKTFSKEEQISEEENGKYITNEDKHTSPLSKQENLIAESLPKTLSREHKIFEEENGKYIKNEDNHTSPLSKQENLIPGSLPEMLSREERISKEEKEKFIQDEYKHSFPLSDLDNLFPESLYKSSSSEENVSSTSEKEEYNQNEDSHFHPLSDLDTFVSGSLTVALANEEQSYKEDSESYYEGELSFTNQAKVNTHHKGNVKSNSLLQSPTNNKEQLGASGSQETSPYWAQPNFLNYFETKRSPIDPKFNTIKYPCELKHSFKNKPLKTFENKIKELNFILSSPQIIRPISTHKLFKFPIYDYIYARKVNEEMVDNPDFTSNYNLPEKKEYVDRTSYRGDPFYLLLLSIQNKETNSDINKSSPYLKQNHQKQGKSNKNNQKNSNNVSDTQSHGSIHNKNAIKHGGPLSRFGDYVSFAGKQNENPKELATEDQEFVFDNEIIFSLATNHLSSFGNEHFSNKNVFVSSTPSISSITEKEDVSNEVAVKEMKTDDRSGYESEGAEIAGNRSVSMQNSFEA